MKKEELDIILENHGKWLRDEGGERADLTGADLRHANLTNANL
ncbi:pentapeptide repeat-containing protein, partial [Listeria monocytogenes]|nr:pentapeptide repeat-containing protein [Listeria monocytogenes]